MHTPSKPPNRWLLPVRKWITNVVVNHIAHEIVRGSTLAPWKVAPRRIWRVATCARHISRETRMRIGSRPPRLRLQFTPTIRKSTYMITGPLCKTVMLYFLVYISHALSRYIRLASLYMVLYTCEYNMNASSLFHAHRFAPKAKSNTHACAVEYIIREHSSCTYDMANKYY